MPFYTLTGAEMVSSQLANPLLAFSTFIHGLGTQFTSRLDDTRRGLASAASFLTLQQPVNKLSLPFASVSQHQGKLENSLSTGQVAKRLVGTSLYTVCNSNKEFVLISNPDGIKSIGLLCFRKEDAEAFLAQVRSRKVEVRGGAKVVPIALDQVYMLKVEGIAFRFLPDPVQIKNALELKSPDVKNGFDGVPVFQSDLLVVKKKNKRYLPLYFQKEDIEKALSTVSKAGRGSDVSQHIMVGSLEDVLKKMEVLPKQVHNVKACRTCFAGALLLAKVDLLMSEKNLGWEDLIFIPPGKSHSQHIQEVVKV